MTIEDINKAIADTAPFIGSGAYDGPSDESLNTLVEFANEHKDLLRKETITYEGKVMNDIPEVKGKYKRLVILEFQMNDGSKNYINVDPDVFKVGDKVNIIFHKVDEEQEEGDGTV